MDPANVNGLNLYCYCNNDSVNFIDFSGRNALPISVAMSETAAGKPRLLNANSVAMTHYTTSIQPNKIIGGMFGNISYTVTTQLNKSETFFVYSNVGNSGVSYGAGVNWGDWLGVSGYVSSNIGIGVNVQLTPWITAGAEVSLLNGISVSGGVILGDTTHEISVNVGWGTIAVACALASIPIPGARALAGLVLLIDILV